MRVAISPWLDVTDCAGVERFASLLLPAVEQAMVPLVEAGEEMRVAVALGLPTARPGLPVDLEKHLRAAMTQAYPEGFAATAVLSEGHAAGLLGMYAACGKMAAGAFDACVVAGVESYLAPETLEWLEEQDQLHGAGSLNNAWGFVPGEGAGAVLLLTEAALERLGLEPMARVLSIGKASEPNRIKTETVCVGEGLTAAFREGLGGLPAGARVSDVYCDMNGEPYRADEFGFACLRTKESFEAASDFIAPADCWGDVSCAFAPLGMVLACLAARKGYANGVYPFLWASSEGGQRGAVLLLAPTPQAK
jgi:3-oxoacyl-[acyl-carrier-protein] synthase-1